MQMLEFQLFRIKVYPSKQRIISHPQKARDLLQKAISDHPSIKRRTGVIWHIGNIEPLDEDGLYFRLGKTTKTRREIYCEGNFEDQEFEEAPYTHVLLDLTTEVCAIAKKPKLAPTSSGIARQLGKLIAKSDTAKYFDTQFEIDELKDPKDMITHLKQAYAVTRFWMTFSRPNPWDTDADFQKPFAKTLEALDAKKGRAQFDGQNLKVEDGLERIARSVASTGDDAAAHIQLEKTGKPITMHLHKNPIFVHHEDVSDLDAKNILLEKIRKKYKSVRGKLKGGK